MSQPRASIILTSYNRPVFLEMAIKSVFNQTEENWELIVADDNSLPVVDNVLYSLLDPEPRASWWKSDVPEEERPNLVRFSVLINQTFPMTRGSIIFYLCDDNEYLPGCVETVCNYFDENPKRSLVYVQQRVLRADLGTGAILQDRGIRIIKAEGRVTSSGVVIRQPQNMLDHNQVIHRRELFGGGWPTAPSYWRNADGVFLSRLVDLEGHHIYPIEKELVLYKILDTSVCRGGDVKANLERMREIL